MGWASVVAKESLTSQIEKGYSESKFTLLRTLSFGGAGVSLIVAGVLPHDISSVGPALYSLVLAAFSMPIWGCLGFIHEYYIFTGKRSYPHYKLPGIKALVGVLFAIAGVALLASIYLLLLTYNSIAAYVFLTCALVSFALTLAFHINLSGYLKSSAGKD